MPRLRLGTRLAARAAVALLSALLPAAAALAAPRPVVWVATATEKIRPSAPARTDAVAKIAAARNEFEAFQVIVTGAARGVTATATALTGPGTIPAPRLYRAALIQLAQASAPDGGAGPWPDALVPAVDELVGQTRNAFPFDVGAGESRAIWAEVLVPPGAPPGTYRGEVRISWRNGNAKIPVELTVWNFGLPSTASLRTSYGLPYGALPAGHGIAKSDFTAFATLRARYGRFALDHRISLSRHDDGLVNDLAWFDQWYGPLVDGTASTRLAGARLTAVEYLGNPTDVAAHATWAQHWRAHGWFDRLFQYVCDEPPKGCTWDALTARATSAKAADPEFRTLVTTTIQTAGANGVTDLVDLLVPVVNFMDDKSGAYAGPQRSRYDAFLAADPLGEVWLYQSCMSHDCGGSSAYGTGWPTNVIDASAIRNRAFPWLAFRYAATGELYFDTTFAYGFGDAWTNQWYFTGNGDGTLFYPGTPAKIGGTADVPVASIRLKLIREGMEDYEYLKLVSDLGDPGLAHQVADDLFPCASCTERPPAKLYAAREQLARRILELRGTPLP